MSSLHYSSDLRIADLPPDLRAEGEALRERYHALAADAGLLTEDGAMDLGRLGDLDTVKSVDLATLRALAETADALESLSDLRPIYDNLPEPVRQALPYKVFAAKPFASEAAERGFPVVRWAQIWTTLVQTGWVLPADTFLPDDPADDDGGLIEVAGDLDLRACPGLTYLPSDLTVRGSLILDGCMKLQQLPPGLRVKKNLSLKGCSALVRMPVELSVGHHVYVAGCTPSLIFHARALQDPMGIVGEVIS